MDAARIHLLFNHFPLVILLIALTVLSIGIYKSNETLIKTALILNIAAFLFTVPLYFSGEGVEEQVEHFSHFDHLSLESHEDFAAIAFGFSFILLLASFLSLKKWQGKTSEWLPKLVLGLGIIGFLLYSVTAHLGGRINHPELRESDEKILKTIGL